MNFSGLYLQTIFLFVMLPIALAIGYFSVGLSNAQAFDGLKRGVPMKTSLLFALAAMLMLTLGYYSGMFLQSRAEHMHLWIPTLMFAFSGFRMIQHAWKNKSAVHIFDLTSTGVVLAMSVALGVNVFFSGVAISYLEVRFPVMLIPIFVMVFLFSFSGLLQGTQFKEDFGRKLEFAAGAFMVSLAFWVVSLQL